MLTPSPEETEENPSTCDDFHHYQHIDRQENFPCFLLPPHWGSNNRTSVEQQFVLNAKSEGRTIASPARTP